MTPHCSEDKPDEFAAAGHSSGALSIDVSTRI